MRFTVLAIAERVGHEVINSLLPGGMFAGVSAREFWGRIPV